jgi:hypothetical protein
VQGQPTNKFRLHLFRRRREIALPMLSQDEKTNAPCISGSYM